MPNWCWNKLEVGGNKKSLTELKKFFKDGFSLETIDPTPKELIDAPAIAPTKPSEVELPAWYNWRLDHWGTKWDLMHKNFKQGEATYLDFSDGVGRAEFHSAWTPPLIALKTLSAKFDKLIFKLKYADDQFNYQGEATIKGNEVWDVCKDVDQNEVMGNTQTEW